MSQNTSEPTGNSRNLSEQIRINDNTSERLRTAIQCRRTPHILKESFITAENSWEHHRRDKKFSRHLKNVSKCLRFFSDHWEPFRTNERISEMLKTSLNIKECLRSFRNLSVLLRSRTNVSERLKHSWSSKTAQNDQEPFWTATILNASEHSRTSESASERSESFKIHSEHTTTFKKASDLPRSSKETSERRFRAAQDP